jgi:hypothetical protein
MVNWLIFLALVTIRLPVYAENLTVDANMCSLCLVVDKSPDGQVHIIKNFDEVYFNYSENIDGDTIRLVSDAQIGINTDHNGRIIYHRNMRDQVVRDDWAKVTVQAPDNVTIKFVSIHGGLTVNDIDCALIDVKTNFGDLTLNRSNWDSIQLDMRGGSIYYTGGIEGKNIGFETGFGDINIELEGVSDVDVDIRSSYSYRKNPSPVMSIGIEPTGNGLSGGWAMTGYTTGRITNKSGPGIINAVSRHGKITCDVSY